MLVQCNSLF